jgi:hypothetical protein
MNNLRTYLSLTLLFQGMTYTHGHLHQVLINKQQKKELRAHRYYVNHAALSLAILKANNDLTLHDLTVSKASDHSHANKLLSDYELHKLIDEHTELVKQLPLASTWWTYNDIRSENKRIIAALPHARRNSISRAHLVEALNAQMEVLRNPAVINLIKTGHKLGINR